MTERDVAEWAERLALESGASGFWSPILVGAGEGNRVCHPDYPPTGRQVAEVDLVYFDVTPTFDGWLGDHCVSIVVGEDALRTRIVGDCLRLQREIIDACRPGLPASELFEVAQAALDREGYELLDLLGNIGHSHGRVFAEHGFIDASNDLPMWGAWTIEPHVGRDGLGAKFEEIIWLGPDGCSVVAA
jgi:Xaa-Pro aminopeptidase